MAEQTAPEACWTFKLPTGGHTGGHWPTKHDARTEGMCHPLCFPTGTTIIQLPAACIIVTCGGDDCSRYLDDDDIVYHLADMDEARACADTCGWTSLADDTFRCPSCASSALPQEAAHA